MGIKDGILYMIEQSKRELIHKKPPVYIKSILDKIKLFEVYPNIFAVVIKDDKLRARVFLRYQEFYESDSESFRGKSFKWNEFVDYYKKKTKKDYFSYYEDWEGYNLPCDTIEACKAKIPDLNIYDMIMFSIVDTIKKINNNSPYYLIGIAQEEGGDESLINHELAHALWFLDPVYKKKMTKAINEMDPSVKEKMIDKIMKYGYGENVFDDELQAYLSTGLGSDMRRIKNIKPQMITFHDIFMEYASKLSPKKIQIDWSTDLDR